MGRLVKYIFYLALLAAIGLLGYAYFGDLEPRQSLTTKKVEPQIDG